MKILDTVELMEAAIASIQRRGAKLDRDIHQMAVSAAMHCTVHGKPDYINKLIDAMPKGSRVNALREWFMQYSPVFYDESSKAFATNKKRAKDNRQEMADGHELPLEIAAGIEVDWTDLKPEAPYKPMDLSVALAKLVKEATKRSALDKGDKIDPALLASLSALAPAEATAH